MVRYTINLYNQNTNTHNNVLNTLNTNTALTAFNTIIYNTLIKNKYKE
jgi:hypothetical protein